MGAKDYGWQPGMTVFVVENDRRAGSPQTFTITRVGRKWVYFDRYGREAAFDPDTMRVRSEFGMGARVYVSEYEYREQCELGQAWNAFRQALPYSPPKGVTVADIQEARELLKLKDD